MIEAQNITRWINYDADRIEAQLSREEGRRALSQPGGSKAP
ncbi:MAG: hypothetical protein WB698_02220 [Solirubrobacteraceae bacterium]|jgi:hypothetical protein